MNIWGFPGLKVSVSVCVLFCPPPQRLGGAVCGHQAADDGVTPVKNASAATAQCHPKRFSMLNPSGVLSETDISGPSALLIHEPISD